MIGERSQGDPDHSPVLQAFAFLIALHGLIHLFRVVTWYNFGGGIEYWYAPLSGIGLTPVEIILAISILALASICAAAACTWHGSTRASQIICIAAVISAVGLIIYVNFMQAAKPRIIEMIREAVEINERLLQVERARLIEFKASKNEREAEWMLDTILWRERELQNGRIALDLMTAPRWAKASH